MALKGMKIFEFIDTKKDFSFNIILIQKESSSLKYTIITDVVSHIENNTKFYKFKRSRKFHILNIYSSRKRIKFTIDIFVCT